MWNVGWVMYTLPANRVFSVRKGRAPAWSRWKWVMNIASMRDKSMRSRNGKEEIPINAGWTPMSKRSWVWRYFMWIQERPTSEPAPRGVIDMLDSYIKG